MNTTHLPPTSASIGSIMRLAVGRRGLPDFPFVPLTRSGSLAAGMMLLLLGTLLRGDLIRAQGAEALTQADQSEDTPDAPRTEIDDRLMERLRREAPQAWDRLRQRTAHQQGSYRKSRSRSWVRNDSQSVSINYALDGDNMKVEFQQKGLMHVLCKNHDYAFQISKSADQPASQYTIQWLEQRGVDKALEKQIEKNGLEFYAWVNAQWWFLGRTFGQWIDEPGFDLHGITPAGENRVRVDYSYMPDDVAAKDHEAIPAAYVVFDLSRDWSICEGGLFMPWGSYRGVYEYGPPYGDLPVIQSSRTIIKGNDGSQLETGFVFDGVTDQPPPLEEFRLSHYGLPEPNFNSGGLMWLVYLGAAVCLFAMAYIWRRRQLA